MCVGGGGGGGGYTCMCMCATVDMRFAGCILYGGYYNTWFTHTGSLTSLELVEYLGGGRVASIE